MSSEAQASWRPRTRRVRCGATSSSRSENGSQRDGRPPVPACHHKLVTRGVS